MLLFVVSLIATLALIVVTLHDSYELRRRLRHASTILQRAIIIGRLCFLWIITLATALTAYLSKVDSDRKDKEIATLDSELAGPTITRKAHDIFVNALVNAPKGEIPIWQSDSPSLQTATYIMLMRNMLDDAGYKVVNDTTDSVPGIVTQYGMDCTNNKPDVSTYIVLYSASVADNPPYVTNILAAFNAAHLNAQYIIPLATSKLKVPKGHIAIAVVDLR